MPWPYGSEEYYGDPALTSWFRTAFQAELCQGPFTSYQPGITGRPGFLQLVKKRVNTKGTLHPNELGHQATKDRLLETFVSPVEIPGIGVSDQDDQMEEAKHWRPAEYWTGDGGEIWIPTDVDMFRIRLNKGDPLEIRWDRRDISALPVVEPRFRLFDSAGNIIKTSPAGRIVDVIIEFTQDGEKRVRNVWKTEYGELDPTWTCYAPERISYEHIASEKGFVYLGVSALRNDTYDRDSGHFDRNGQSTGRYAVDMRLTPAP